MSRPADLMKYLSPGPRPPRAVAGLHTTFGRFAAVLAAALALISLYCGNARAGVGGTFAVTHHDARGLAMGGACVSLARGDAAVRWNPARLPYQTARSATVAHGDAIEDFSSGLTTISAAVPWGGAPTDEYGLGRSARWAAAGFISYFGLEDVGGSSNWSETALLGAAARTLWGFASVGLSVRYLNVSSDIEGGNADGVAADLAFSLDTTDGTRAALVVRSAAGSLNWESGYDERLPTSVDLAFSYIGCECAAAEVTVNIDADGVATSAVGAEASVAGGGLLVWGGFKLINDDSPRKIPSFGIGVPLAGFTIGYGASFDGDDTFGTTQRFSVTATF
jgi:hypothetical protein